MKSSREQFEEWWATYVDKCSHLVEDVEYYAAKEAWQASRAEIEIALPDCDDYQSTWQYQDAAEIKIKELGLTVK